MADSGLVDDVPGEGDELWALGGNLLQQVPVVLPVLVAVEVGQVHHPHPLKALGQAGDGHLGVGHLQPPKLPV